MGQRQLEDVHLRCPNRCYNEYTMEKVLAAEKCGFGYCVQEYHVLCNKKKLSFGGQFFYVYQQENITFYRTVG